MALAHPINTRSMIKGAVTGLLGKRGKVKVDHATQTGLSQSLDIVLPRLNENGHRRVLVLGDRAFLDQVKMTAPDLKTSWASCALSDVISGAVNPDIADFAEVEAVICGGSDVVAGYRLAVARMADVDASRPVHWVAENWEFCGGTLSLPAEIDEVEAVLFNHFRHYFGIKDALQFRIEVYCGDRVKKFYRILRADESLILRLSDYYPKWDKTVAFAAFVSHPALTRGRHYRLRVCADAFWRDSFTTLHGAHEFNRSPNHKFEFRVSSEICRHGDIILTIPNFARDIGRNGQLITAIDQRMVERSRDHAAFVEEDRVTAEMINGSRFVGWKYRGYGGSNWFALQSEIGANARGNIAANHHATVPIEPLVDMEMEPAEREQLRLLREAGYIISPHPVPVTRSDHFLRYGIDCDSSNPTFKDFWIYRFGKLGDFLGETRFQKNKAGPVFAEDLPGVAEDINVGMVLVAPDFERIGVRRKGFKIQPDFIVQNRATNDWDTTEFQDCWRNIGIVVPQTAHFAGPTGPVIGRTNLFARARVGRGYRTAIVACHGSGRLDYRRIGHLTLAVFDAKGRQRTVEVQLPAFTWKAIWLDEIWLDIEKFLAPTGLGPLLATAPDADINCQIITTSNDGAVSIQHMWGY
jgi:hypothetical protein